MILSKLNGPLWVNKVILNWIMARSEKDDGKLRSIRSSTLYRKLRASDRILTVTILWGFANKQTKPSTIKHFAVVGSPRLAGQSKSQLVFVILQYPLKPTDVDLWRLRSTITHCRTTVGQNTQLLWEQIDFNFTVGRCFVSDKNRVYYIPTRRNTMSDGDVKVCLSYDSACSLIGASMSNLSQGKPR